MLSFNLFGTCHLLTLLGIGVITGCLILLCRRGSERVKSRVCILLAACCLLSYALQHYLWNHAGYGFTTENAIPLHLCDLAAFICGLALLTRSALLCELSYFWGLAGTLQGLLTPDLNFDFPHPLYISFFWKHGFIVITALFLPLGLGWRPRPGTVWRIFLITQLYAAVAMLTNFLLGTNYGFLRTKPDSASLLDALPAWPWYILVLEAIALILYFLLNLPFYKRSVK